MKTALTLIALSLPLLAAAQQTIWRCGPDGRSYSNVPCAEGRALEIVEARPAADLQAAQSVAARDKRLAEQMRSQRLREEAAAAKLGPAGIGDGRAETLKTAAKAQAPRKPFHPKAKHRPEADGTWRAVAPATRQTKG